MAVPKLTSQQRAEALAQAAQSRAARAEIRAQVKSKALTIADVVALADGNPVIAKMRVSALLEALPSIGKTRSHAIMERLGISPTRRLQGLGAVQRRALLNEFRD
ncbi:MAG: integration host factor [Actinobacteria bacterium]|nr:integration host factor [Actinomycetota bacterium]